MSATTSPRLRPCPARLEARWIPPRPIRPRREPGWREAIRVGTVALPAAWLLAELALLVLG